MENMASKARFAYFIVMVILDVIDLFSDWFLYIDVSMVEEGLVYGPLEPSVIHALLAFTIIGSVTFLCEVVTLWLELFRDKQYLNSDLISVIAIWIGDLPQIAINVHIARCREDPISIFQLCKASVVLLGLLIRIVICGIKYCNKRARQEAEDTKRHKVYRVLIFIGLLINAGCAIAVFVLTQTHKDANNVIKFPTPETVFDEKYHYEQRYFQNVSIFVHPPEFQSLPPTPDRALKTPWIRLTTINDIRDHGCIDLTFKYTYQRTNQNFNLAFYEKWIHGGWGLTECYQQDLRSDVITALNQSSCPSSPNATSFIIKFSLTPPGWIFKDFIFGDIKYNVRMYQEGVCRNFTSINDIPLYNPNIPFIQYYRTMATIHASDAKHLLFQDGIPRFYGNDVDLQDMSYVWKTGFDKCDSSGSKAPHFQTDIAVPCS